MVKKAPLDKKEKTVKKTAAGGKSAGKTSVSKKTAAKKIVAKKATPKKKATSNSRAMNAEIMEASALKLKEDQLIWVGIGASAGGLEALRSFVSNLPKKSRNGITYIVAQHLSPKHPSMLVQLLTRETDIKVEELKDGQKPQADVIYITPPDSDVFVANGTLHLRAPESEFSPKPSVDYFFSTLAEDLKDRAIGIILSGTGSDGSHGVRAIRAVGGITIAQEVKTAKFDGMPGSAIDTGCVDIILPPEKMGEQVASIIASPRSLELLQEETQRTDIQELLYLLKERCGVDFNNYKTGTLYRRIDRRMAACSVAGLDGYLSYVRENKQELDELYSDILISVTNFFRDGDAFDALKTTIQEIIKNKEKGDPIRVWVPGCATGEEAYSLVILFAEALGGLRKLSEYNFQLFASDIGSNILSQARKGIYPRITLENVDPHIKDSYFRSRDNSYEIIKGIRDYVVFSKHNVFEDPPFLRLDLISCRNLLIYFNAKLQSTVMSLFHYALQQNGFLFLGKSESLGHSTNLFQAIDNKSKIFKRNLITNADKDTLFNSTYTPVRRIETPPAPSNNKTLHDLPDAMIQALSPDSILIDENMDVIRIYGDVQPYTQLSAGSFSMNLMSLAKKEFRQELRALVYKVLRESAIEMLLPKKMNIGGTVQNINIYIRPLQVKNSAETFILVSFEKARKIANTSSQHAQSDTSDPIIAELEQELVSTREHLQTVVEELETSNEELQSTNEELQSSNEELQSSNEELETANEELQSTNEELLTVNEELQIKTHELTVANEDLLNVKDSFDFPLIVVNKDLKIKLFNASSKDIFIIAAEDAKEVITNISTHIDIPDLRRNILGVIRDGRPFSRQIDTSSVCYLERITPYKMEDGKIEGAVLTYIDNTEARRFEKQLKISEERYQLAVDGSSVGLWDWHIEKDIFYGSPKFLSMLETSEKNFEPHFNFLKSRIHDDDKDDVLTILNAHIEKGFDFNIECRLRVGKNTRANSAKQRMGYIWAHIRGQAIWDKNNKAIRMSGSLNDVTDRRLMIEQLRDSNEALSRFAYVCSHDLKEPARLANNFAGLLDDTYAPQLDEEGREYLMHIKDSTERMQSMIKDMLIYSQVENKNTSLAKVDCAEEIDKVLKNLALTIKETDAQVTYIDLPTIHADRTQVFQLFQNLIGNGIKFCEGKQPKVHIDATESKEEWTFSIKDNGIGMRKEHTQRIFNVFQRLNKSEDFGGTGIGLSICQKIVHRHGGRIWVESSLGKGSTFYFSLPKNFVRRHANDLNLSPNEQ